MEARISLVVPAWNEEACLPRLLDSVDAARARYDGELEVVVADNGSMGGRWRPGRRTRGSGDVPRRR